MRRSSDEIKMRRKLRIVKFSSRNVRELWLCKECDNYLVSENKGKIAKSSVNTWPAFISSVLLNPKVIKSYGIKVWQLIPKVWRHWWLENIKKHEPVYFDITIEHPKPIIIDRSIENKEWDRDITSQLLPNIANFCDKHTIPTVLCL